MKLPLSENNIDGKVDVGKMYRKALKAAKPDKTQKQVIELLGRERNVDTLRAVCELIPAKKFESYKPNALVERARWRVGRLDKACEGVFDAGRVNILEIGCGRGEMLSALMERYDARCVGLDPVESLFINNRKDAPELYDAMMIKGFAEEIPFCEANFDLVLGYNSMEHFTDPRQVVDESHRVLKPGGAMYFWFGPPFNGPYGPHLQNRLGLPYVHHLFAPEVVAEYLGVSGDPYKGKNGWSTQRFRQLFTQDPRVVCTYYREEYVWDHLWLVKALPDEFAELTPPELVIRAIEVTCVKDGLRAREQFVAKRRAMVGIDLSAGIVDTQDGRTTNAVLGNAANRFGIKLNNSNDPRKGDYTRYSLTIPTTPGEAKQLSLRVHNSYRNEKYPGRIAWTLKINSKDCHTEDISADGAANELAVAIDAGADLVELELRLDALRNCEPWSWGDASKVWIDQVKLTPVQA